MIKISATQLEGFNRLKQGKIGLELLWRQLLKLEGPNVYMEQGTQFHELLQADAVTPEQCEPHFDFEDITQARTNIDYRCKAFEVKLRTKIKTFDNTPVVITGVADQLLPGKVIEYKTRYSAFQYEGYANSMQWRLYCYLFDVPTVNYKVWEMKLNKATGKQNVASYNDFHLHEYPNLEHDLRTAITEFTELLKRLKLDKHEYFTFNEETQCVTT